MQSPRGPTFVSVPVDDWDRECAKMEARTVSNAVSGDSALLARAGTALSAARRPVIVVGASVARDGAWDGVIALAERHQTPVWVTGQVLTATAGESFPVTPVPRATSPAPSSLNAVPSTGPSVPTPPPAAGSTAKDLQESLGHGSPGAASPAIGEGKSAAKPPATGGIPGQAPSEAGQPEGAEPEPAPAAPPFEASANPGPKPWVPLGVGLGAAGLALGSVLLLGRRFSW